MAIFTIRGENSNCCQIKHFPVSKQTMKVQFSLDTLGKNLINSEANKKKIKNASIRKKETGYRRKEKQRGRVQKMSTVQTCAKRNIYVF